MNVLSEQVLLELAKNIALNYDCDYKLYEIWIVRVKT